MKRFGWIAVLASSVFGCGDKSPVVPELATPAELRAVQERIETVENELRLYAVNHDGEYPEGGSDTLRQMAPTFADPPEDIWGTTMFYQYPPRHNAETGKPDIWSAGPNRKDDGGKVDDIGNW